MKLFFRNSRRAFSLVELMIVAGIVAMLAALAVPALSSVQYKSRASASFQNLRQWAQALVTFSSDNLGEVPYEGSRDNFSWSQLGDVPRGDDRAWFNVLPPYVGAKAMKDITDARERRFDTVETKIFKCPLVRVKNTASPVFCYFMNSQLYHADGPANSADNPLRMASIPNPSRTVIFADANTGPDLSNATNSRARGRGRHVGERQPRKSVNLVMLDGSVRNLPAAYVRPDTFTTNGITYTDNNRPDLVWNPWIMPAP